MAVKQLEVSLDELSAMMEDRTGQLKHFLDTQTGTVESIPADVMSKLADSEDESDDDGALREWQREQRQLARQILADEDRYVPIPPGNSGESYRVMEDFIETVRSGPLQEKLWAAIAGKGAFRRFKDVLLNYPQVRNGLPSKPA